MNTTCPWCSKVNDLTSAVMDKDDHEIPRPTSGDLIMCMSCGAFAAFDENGQLRRPTRQEVVEIGLDPKCRAMRLAWRDLHPPL